MGTLARNGLMTETNKKLIPTLLLQLGLLKNPIASRDWLRLAEISKRKKISLLNNHMLNYRLKVNNRNNRSRCKICSKLTITTPERHHSLVKKFVYLGLWHQKALIPEKPIYIFLLPRLNVNSMIPFSTLVRSKWGNLV